ncbi:hypothetical protein OF83DRAFT_1158027 [Amylostereum chailletii]|nr:hypothetical protein OF83DRAFT_1158027 [Amylostereum chailletii]
MLPKVALATVFLACAPQIHAQTFDQQPGGFHLVGGSVAGIALAVVAGLIVLSIIIRFFCFRSAARRRRAMGMNPPVNIGYSSFPLNRYGPPPGPPPPPAPSYGQGYPQEQNFRLSVGGEGGGQYYAPPSAPPPAYTPVRRYAYFFPCIVSHSYLRAPQAPSRKYDQTDAQFGGGFK